MDEICDCLIVQESFDRFLGAHLGLVMPLGQLHFILSRTHLGLVMPLGPQHFILSSVHLVLLEEFNFVCLYQRSCDLKEMNRIRLQKKTVFSPNFREEKEVHVHV
jgi:hypothetical protein